MLLCDGINGELILERWLNG